ncbi:hypothetical protein N7491_001087 [Penicillium cf. griseofulvum]|nr:hypothetical protein N7491_001087 [Penicillium cf. griseofulvum]
MTDNTIVSCPFCPFADSDADFVSQHIEFCHPETRETNLLHDNQQDLTGQNSALWPVDEDSADKYGYEDDRSFDDEDPPRYARLPQRRQTWGTTRLLTSKHREATTASQSPKDNQCRWHKAIRVLTNIQRSELGPYAHEKRMPSWLKKMLESGDKLKRRETVENETDHLIPALAQLCEQDKSVQRAFFCSPKVRHICKMRREGGFCGYRNIQMMVSWLIKSRSFGHKHFPKGPTILELQDMIESAWDMGFNSSGRAETGGIKDTRKFIGTPEAQALFMSLEIPCEARSLSEKNGVRAHDALYIDVADYFRSACSPGDDSKILQTDLPPIYFQHQGHSMTIVGFEIRENGSANLLVFDPMFKTSPAMERLIGAFVEPSDPTRLLKAYRRGTPYLQNEWLFQQNMRTSPNVIITGTPGVGKTVHCEQLAQEIGLKHLSINQVAKDRGCFDEYDEELKTWVVDEDKLLDALEDEIPNGGYLIDWHACDLFPKSWIDLVVVLRCPTTDVLYDRLSSRGYHEKKLDENIDAEIFGVLSDEAREAFDEEIVVELNSEQDSDVDSNCQRIAQWVDSWKQSHAENAD